MRAWASSGSSELQVPTVGTLLMSGSGIRRVLQRFLHKWCIGRLSREVSVFEPSESAMLMATEGCVQKRDCDHNRGNCYREDEEYWDEARAARDWVTVTDTNSGCHISLTCQRD